MARSSELSVVKMLPCVNCWVTDDSATPMPIGLDETPFIALA